MPPNCSRCSLRNGPSTALVDAGLVLTEEELKERYRPEDGTRRRAGARLSRRVRRARQLLDLLEKRAPKAGGSPLGLLGVQRQLGVRWSPRSPCCSDLGAGTEVLRKLEERGVLRRSKRPELASAAVQPGPEPVAPHPQSCTKNGLPMRSSQVEMPAA